MIISDLNLLETVEATEVVGGWGRRSYGNGKKNKKITNIASSNYYQSDLNVGFTGKLTLVKVSVKGNDAEASSNAMAEGDNTYTKTASGTYTSDYGSESGSYSKSSTGYSKSY